MATAAEIQLVRENTNEPSATVFSDVVIGGYVDTLGGVDAASAKVWRLKAATYVELVDTSEAGSSRKYSDLYKNASAEAERFEAAAGIFLPVPTKLRAKTHLIERLT